MSALTSLLARRVSMGALGAAAAVTALGVAGVTLASLAGGGIGPDPYTGSNSTFPDDLVTNDHWISFQAVQTNGAAASTINSMLGITIGSNFNVPGGSVFLPMPSNLSTDYNPEYTPKDLDMAAGSVLKPFDRAIYGNQDINDSAALGAGMAGIAGGFAGSRGAKVAGEVASAFGASGGDTLAAALKVSAGIAQNPHKIILFTGVGFRDHTFSWKLSPKNRYESDTIKSIIDFFVYYSHPEYVAGGLFFKYPEFFQIKFAHPDYLFELRPSVCKDVKVNYHTQGYAAYVRNADGSGAPAPAEVELTLTFTETEIVTKNSLNPPIRVTNNPGRPPVIQSFGPIVTSDGLPLFGS